jgi:hypothetical protein
LHGRSNGIELDRDNRIVLRKGKKAPVDKETLVEALKAELRKMKASGDPLYFLQCEYVEKLRTFLDQDTPYKEVIAIDRKVRTRWGAQGAASFNEDRVDLVATIYNLTKVRAELNSAKGFNAGGRGGGGGGDGRDSERVLGDRNTGGACWAFNREKGCFRPEKDCNFSHECGSCGSKAHGAHACKPER